MIHLLAAGDDAVMATAAYTDHLAVIDRGRRHRLPGYRTLLVARIADIAGPDMRH